jgi:hypothetical protein
MESMTNKSRSIAAVLGVMLCLSLSLRAQDKMPIKFGKITPDDFKVTGAKLDSAAEALVIADFGISSFEGNAKGWFDLTFKHSKRIRILKRTGFEAATIKIRYTSARPNPRGSSG